MVPRPTSSEPSPKRSGPSRAGRFLAALFEPELRAWRGEAPLARVFWVYGVCVSSVLVLLYVPALYENRLGVQQVMLFVLAGYTVWILVSVWRCAASARSFWGVLAQWLTVAWAGNAILVLAFLQLDLVGRYLGH